MSFFCQCSLVMAFVLGIALLVLALTTPTLAFVPIGGGTATHVTITGNALLQKVTETCKAVADEAGYEFKPTVGWTTTTHTNTVTQSSFMAQNDEPTNMTKLQQMWLKQDVHSTFYTVITRIVCFNQNIKVYLGHNLIEEWALLPTGLFTWGAGQGLSGPKSNRGSVWCQVSCGSTRNLHSKWIGGSWFCQ